MNKPTKEEQLVALQESIEHWEAMLTTPIKKIKMTSDACACCTLAERYTPQNQEENSLGDEIDCKFCPITTIDEDYDACTYTPFYDARDAYLDIFYDSHPDRSKLDRRIMNEIEFLMDVKSEIEGLGK